MNKQGIHTNTKLVSCRKNHTCEYCHKQIKAGEKAYRTNTKFIKPFYRCLNHCPTKQEITNMIQEEMQEYHYNDIEIDEGDF